MGPHRGEGADPSPRDVLRATPRRRPRARSALLDLFFGCLDALRDYHAELRAKGQSYVDLSGLTASVIEAALGSGLEDAEAEPVPEAFRACS